VDGEVGSRGRLDRWTGTITLYCSEIRDELLQFTVRRASGHDLQRAEDAPSGCRTGGSVEIWRDILGPAKGDTLTLSQLWNYSDFRFVDDPIYGSNKIAGTPEHSCGTIATYRHPNGFYLAPSVDFIPTGTWVDYAIRCARRRTHS